MIRIQMERHAIQPMTESLQCPNDTEQLAVGGRMILPLGNGGQELVLLRKTDSGLEREVSLPVRFVPMTGEAMKPREP